MRSSDREVKVFETPRSVDAASGLWVSLRVEHRRTRYHQPSTPLCPTRL